VSPDQTTCVRPRCPRALANQGGYHYRWNEILLALSLCASMPCGPSQRTGCVESIGDCLHSFQSQHECAVAPGCWSHPCASCPRKSCLIGDCRKQAYSIGDCRTSRGPSIGWTELFGPACVRPGTLRTCTPAGRQHISFSVHARLTHTVSTSTDLVSVWTTAAAVPQLEPL